MSNENLLIKPGNYDIIERGSVLNHETSSYQFGLGGLIMENPFVVRSSGNEVLTTIGNDLFVIP